MFVFSLKTNKKKILAYTFLALIGIVLIFTLVYIRGQNVSNGYPETVLHTVNGNEQRVEFIKSFGWEIDKEPIEVKEVIIPSEFNDVFSNYNSIQKKQGFNLEKYKGKTVKRYCYNVLNYPNTEDDVRINLLVLDNKIIGGDVCSVKLDGFMHGFNFPKTE